MKKTFFCSALILCFFAVRSLHAAEPQDSSTCLEEIKTVCMGLEDHMDRCLTERVGELSAACRDLLKNAVSMAEATSGPGVCVKDVKTACPNLEGNLLAQCIVDKKAGFSPSCRDYLDAASNASPDAK